MHALLLALAVAAGPGSLVAPQAEADRGAVRTGPPLAHSFAVTNSSATTVHLLGVTTPCGCIAPGVSRDTLAPGESATVTLVVNTLTPAAGKQTWRGVVRYAADGPAGAAPALGELPWALTAELVRELALTPPALALTASGDRPVSVTIIVTDSRAKPLTVRGVAATSPHLTATVGVANDSPAGRAISVTVRLASTLPEGEFAEMLVIHTDDPACPELRLPVTLAKKSAAVAVARPEVATITLAPGQTSGSMLLQLRSPAGVPLKLASATSDDARVTVKAAAAGRLLTVRVTVTPPANEPAGSATVTVTVADPAGEVTIPVRWSRR